MQELMPQLRQRIYLEKHGENDSSEMRVEVAYSHRKDHHSIRTCVPSISIEAAPRYLRTLQRRSLERTQ